MFTKFTDAFSVVLGRQFPARIRCWKFAHVQIQFSCMRTSITGSASVPSRSWDGFPNRQDRPRFRVLLTVLAIPNGSNNGHLRLRDQLCLLIRQYCLDPTPVKAYAADFWGTQAIKDASRDLVESFITHQSSSAKSDLDGLICELSSYDVSFCGSKLDCKHVFRSDGL